MIEAIFTLDRSIFYAINHLPHTLWSDWAMATVSAIGSLGVGWVLIAAVLILRYNYRDRRYLKTFILSLIVTAALTTVIKYFIGRSRPEFVIPDVIASYPCIDILCRAQSQSFPSFHAALSFCAAYILGYGKRRHDVMWYSIAGLISFSRIYLGKHFPSDVLVGTLLGLTVGFIMMRSFHIRTKSK